MTLSISPYLIAPPSGLSPRPAADTKAAPQNQPTGPQAATDSITLSPAAQQAMKTAPLDANKTKLQSTLETILTSVQNSTGSTLTFQPAPDSQTGKNLDQSC